MQTFIDTPYTDGRKMDDGEVVGLLIGMLLGGQHTSSTTSSWLGLYIARDEALQEALYEEQMSVRGGDPITYDHLEEMDLLDRCLRETLRLRAPLITTMRVCKVPVQVLGYDIPVDTHVCISASVNHRLKNVWHNVDNFDPDRLFVGFYDSFLEYDVSKIGRYSYIPFGQGRHRCIGESFAYVQIKTIWAHLIQKFRFSLPGGRFPDVDLTTMIQAPKHPIINYTLRN
ncbi:lanosterol 14-alpha demethylase-like [Octopus sinensis]|uniref:Lanosterol 14-alpha demethylase-like n=1 Tax=Octopus sinensis TaxID=2607531 RepID=A0A6P7TWD7_9MOLL|nr:lanosterol 14-alpha demethylase-like [Octopus sinensis]